MHGDKIVSIVAIALLFGGPCLVIILSRLFRTIEVTARSHQATVLRMKMVDRGYTASEIERVCGLPLDEQRRAVESEWVPVAPAKPGRA